METQDTQDLVTMKGAASILDKCPDTVRAWTHRGLLRAIRLPDGTRVYRRSELEELARAQRQDLEAVTQ